MARPENHMADFFDRMKDQMRQRARRVHIENVKLEAREWNPDRKWRVLFEHIDYPADRNRRIELLERAYARFMEDARSNYAGVLPYTKFVIKGAILSERLARARDNHMASSFRAGVAAE